MESNILKLGITGKEGFHVFNPARILFYYEPGRYSQANKLTN
jgi:hypothetical protein